jgi:putative endonuclease
LVERGMCVIARRFRTRSGEIDLVARDGETVVFVEVKTRRSLRAGRPADAVTREKQKRLALAAMAFLQRRGWLDRVARFDVVEILAPVDGPMRLRHVAGAFRPEAR